MVVGLSYSLGEATDGADGVGLLADAVEAVLASLSPRLHLREHGGETLHQISQAGTSEPVLPVKLVA